MHFFIYLLPEQADGHFQRTKSDSHLELLEDVLLTLDHSQRQEFVADGCQHLEGNA